MQLFRAAFVKNKCNFFRILVQQKLALLICFINYNKRDWIRFAFIMYCHRLRPRVSQKIINLSLALPYDVLRQKIAQTSRVSCRTKDLKHRRTQNV